MAMRPIPKDNTAPATQDTPRRTTVYKNDEEPIHEARSRNNHHDRNGQIETISRKDPDETRIDRKSREDGRTRGVAPSASAPLETTTWTRQKWWISF
jgi:hypothetical protein